MGSDELGIGAKSARKKILASMHLDSGGGEKPKDQ